MYLTKIFRPFRVRPRFGLRALLVLTTIIAVWLAIHLQRTTTQREAVQAIREYGGWVRYDYQFPSGSYGDKDYDGKALPTVPVFLIQRLGIDFFQSVVQVSLNYSVDSGSRLTNDNQSDAALKLLPSFPKLKVLLLSDHQASDDGLKYVGELRQLEYLYMWDVAAVSDAGVAHLASLHRLKYVHLSTSQITDKSLTIFAGMPRLEGLSLQFNHFTDKGVMQLTGLARLKSLWVCGREDRSNAISDSSLKEIEKLQSLVELGIQNTDVTPAGIARLKIALPGCKVSE